MGKSSQRITTSGDSENNTFGFHEAHYVSSSPQEDRSFSKSKVGEVKGGAEEGRIASCGKTSG
jgi:hypothetical protein